MAHGLRISHHIMPLVINALGGGHTDRQTDRHTHITTCKPKQCQGNQARAVFGRVRLVKKSSDITTRVTLLQFNIIPTEVEGLKY